MVPDMASEQLLVLLSSRCQDEKAWEPYVLTSKAAYRLLAQVLAQ